MLGLGGGLRFKSLFGKHFDHLGKLFKSFGCERAVAIESSRDVDIKTLSFFEINSVLQDLNNFHKWSKCFPNKDLNHRPPQQ